MDRILSNIIVTIKTIMYYLMTIYPLDGNYHYFDHVLSFILTLLLSWSPNLFRSSLGNTHNIHIDIILINV